MALAILKGVSKVWSVLVYAFLPCCPTGLSGIRLDCFIVNTNMVESELDLALWEEEGEIFLSERLANVSTLGYGGSTERRVLSY
jgi:hypothetical protein